MPFFIIANKSPIIILIKAFYKILYASKKAKKT